MQARTDCSKCSTVAELSAMLTGLLNNFLATKELHPWKEPDHENPPQLMPQETIEELDWSAEPADMLQA